MTFKIINQILCTKMWREAGLEEELRRMQRDIDRKLREVPPPRQIFEEPEDETDETEEPGEPGEKDQTDESSDPAADEDAEIGATGPLAATDAAEAGSSGEVEHGASEAAGGPYALDDRRELPPDDDGDEAAGQVDSPERADADDSDSGDSEAAGRETA